MENVEKNLPNFFYFLVMKHDKYTSQQNLLLYFLDFPVY